METEQLKFILEAALVTAEEPLSIDELLDLFDEQEQPDKVQLEQALAVLAQDYLSRSIQLQQVASGYCFQVGEAYAPWVAQRKQLKPPKYSRTLLETLAIIAYRQPITRAEIEAIRGVATNSQVVKTLLDREWIKVIGHRETPGRPAIYGTTKAFLDYFNLCGLQDLPPLDEIKDFDTLLASLNVQTDEAQLSPETEPETDQLSLLIDPAET
jgi:segregation and condensation protein B